MAVAAAPVSPSGPVVAPTATVPAGDGTTPPAVDAPKLQIQVVVYSDVPDYAIVAGNPARIVGWAPPGNERPERPSSGAR